MIYTLVDGGEINVTDVSGHRRGDRVGTFQLGLIESGGSVMVQGSMYSEDEATTLGVTRWADLLDAPMSEVGAVNVTLFPYMRVYTTYEFSGKLLT